MKIGGIAKFFIEIFSSDELVKAIQWARKNHERFFVLGLGANTIFSDKGFDGVVILQKNERFEIQDEIVFAESGVVLKNLIEETLNANLLGLEDFSGIPSTIGGASFINLHYYKTLFSDFLVSAKIFDIEKNEIFNVETNWFEYGYEKSKLQTGNFILLSVNLKLKKCSDEEKWFAKGRSFEIIRDRNFKYPQEPSVGSIFQNLPLSAKEFYGIPTLSAGFYIDSLGFKMKKVGGIQVSGRHANIFINPDGNGTCKDLLELMEIVKNSVKEKFGIDLTPEIRIVE
ncbi:MAG: UDP-N-acetylmuramate dehydrogenase [Patescibacteria group bacterium]